MATCTHKLPPVKQHVQPAPSEAHSLPLTSATYALAQALNIYIALLERRRLLASAQRQNSQGSPGPASSTVDADLEKVIQAIVPHVPMLATVLSTSSPSAVLVGSLHKHHAHVAWQLLPWICIGCKHEHWACKV